MQENAKVESPMKEWCSRFATFMNELLFRQIKYSTTIDDTWSYCTLSEGSKKR